MGKKYNRIIIVGNGYDLALKLPTSYCDFIAWHLKEAAKISLNRPYVDDPLFKIKYTHFGNKEQIVSILNSEKDFIRFLEIFNRHFKLEYQSEFFELLMQQVSDKNWVDIENLYFNLIIQKIKVIQKAEPLNRNYEVIEQLNSQLDFIKIRLQDYLNFVQSNFGISPIDSPMNSMHSEFNEKLFREQAYIVHKVVDSELNHPSKVIFLNFNYTNYLSQIVYSRWRDNHIIQIHGELNHSKNQIIFGYGDDSHPIYEILENEPSDEPLKQIKSFYYPKTNNYHTILDSMSELPFEVFIVGHSCGLSDRTLLKTIFEHDNCVGIKIYHRGNEHDHFLKNIAISRHFKDKSKLRNKILPFDQDAVIPQS
jgi:hypothetical protein